MSEPAPVIKSSELPLDEVMRLGAADTLFYGRYWFPRAIRSASPGFHRRIVELVESAANRYVGVKVFRDGAKTTLLRVIVSKRIAYGISRTILFISSAQGHSIRSLRWIKKQVEFNSRWARAFGLRPGTKWSDEEIEIINDKLGITVTLIAMGITGQTRGVNVDDYRPDLIIVDDACDDENTKTTEQRKKISDLVFGALLKGLAPREDNPFAKLVILQTPLHREDLIETAMRDPQFATASFGCFTEDGEYSQWPARKPYEDLLADKQAHIARGQLSLWLREMECKVISEELVAFNKDWMQYWDDLPEGMIHYIGVDPTPPPKDSEQMTASAKLDDACIICIGVWKARVYVIDYYVTKSPNPEEFISKIFEYMIRFKPINVGFESILFARVMKHYLEREMHKRRIFFQVTPVEDKRKKSVRIKQALTGRASNRTLYVHRSHVQLVDQFASYPDVAHDDILDALSIALELINPAIDSGVTLEGDYDVLEEHIEDMPQRGDCP